MKKIICKIGMLVILVFFSQYILTICILQINNERVQNYWVRFDLYVRLNQYLTSNTDILFLGDCTVSSSKLHDKDKQSIPELLQSMIPEYSLAYLFHPAYHMDLYLEYCKYIVKQKNRPKLIIIPINMRSFSPEWDKRPQYQFERETIILRGGLKKYFILAFDKLFLLLKYNFFSISRDEYMHEPVYCGNKKIGTVADFLHLKSKDKSEKIIKNKLIFFYMYSLQASHRKVKSLQKIAELLSKNQIQLIFYITPIDHQTGERFFPGLFSKRLAENIEVIRAALNNEGIDIMDFSTIVPRKAFTWVTFPKEQIGSMGKTAIAERLVHRVRKLLSF